MKDRIDEIVAQWGAERPDLDTRAMALVGRIQRAAAALRPLLDAVHAESGLSFESFDVLAALRRSGPPYQLTPTDLYRQMMLTSGAMTNRIDRLEAAGYVVRKANPNDRRGTFVKLTPRGKTLLDSAVEKHVANETRLISALSPGERKQLDTLLRKLLLSLDDRAS